MISQPLFPLRYLGNAMVFVSLDAIRFKKKKKMKKKKMKKSFGPSKSNYLLDGHD
jgi:hypothetical protein